MNAPDAAHATTQWHKEAPHSPTHRANRTPPLEAGSAYVPAVVRQFTHAPVPLSTIALALAKRVSRRAASVAGNFPAPQTRMLFSVTNPAMDTLMKLGITILVKQVAPDALKGWLFALSGKQLPVLTTEDPTRMEAPARQHNDRERHPNFHES